MSHGYRAAMALNNVATSLLTRGCHRQALETLKDAVFLMQTATRPGMVEDASYAHHVQELAQKAFQRLATSEPSSGTSPLPCLGLRDTDDVAHIFDSNAIESSKAFLIRFDETETSHRDADIDSAIILHNYGLACLIAASSSMKINAKLQSNAFRLLQLSHDIAVGHMESETHDDIHMQRIFLLAMCTTKSLALALFQTSRTGEMKQCMERLEALKRIVQELGMFTPFSRHTATAAAA